MPQKAENSGPCGVCYPQNRLFTHLRHYGRATTVGTVWCCPSGSWLGRDSAELPASKEPNFSYPSDPSGLTMDGQSRANGQQARKIVQWNVEGVRLKKTDLQLFLKLKAIDVCCIQETHLSSSHRCFISGYEVFRQDRENRPKGGLLTLVRSNIPAAEIQRSGQADLDTEYLGFKLVLAGTPVTVLTSIQHLTSRSSYTTSK